MYKIRFSHILIGLALITSLLMATQPMTPAFALSLPAGTASSINSITSSASSSLASCHTFVKDRHVTLEHHGDLTVLHISETLVIECGGKIIERHISYTVVRR